MSGGRVSLIMAETALELVPRELYWHTSVRNHAQRLGKNVSEILLDRSFHHSAMNSGQFKMAWKRGRPDITHFALQEALSTPLYLDGLLDVYIHTIDNNVIKVGPDLRVPKSYFRFEGVIMKLFRDRSIRDKGDRILLELHDNITFENLINNMIGSNNVVGLTSIGAQSTADQIVFRNCSKSKNASCTFVIGGFPKGHFSECTSKLFHHSYSIGRYALESHVVIARILYECEKIMLCAESSSRGAYE
jgi:rRNA small subunit pseudouridine methyltransferase Nep1